MSRNHDRHGQNVYGSLHKKARKRWAPRVRAGLVHCWRCGRLIAPGATWDLGHVDEDGQARGFPLRHPEHTSCNRATVTHLKEKLGKAEGRFGGLPDPTATNTVERWSIHWCGGFNPRCRDCRERGSACDHALEWERKHGEAA